MIVPLRATALVLLLTQTGTAEEPRRVAPGEALKIAIEASDRPRCLSIVVSIAAPDRLAPGVPVAVRVELAGDALEKTLHLGDPDVAWMLQAPAHAAGVLTLTSDARQRKALMIRVHVAEVGESAPDGVVFEREPNDTPASAQQIEFGRTVYALADDRPYLQLGELPTEAESTAGRDWYRLEFAEDTPKLVFFGIEFIDRDVPPDVRIYTLGSAGEPVEYTRGIDPQSAQREVPPRPGANKFTTRVLSRGTYFVMVDACQPDYQLRTRAYDVPPYLTQEDAQDDLRNAAAARLAVRTAMDFQLLAGDSWHANTPRRGHPTDRISNPHHETSTCIACHPTHFTTQSALSAVRNGYKVEQPFALQFLTERLANNPVPFYGHPGSVWARMIPAPANVLGRLSTIEMDYEDLVTREERNNLHRSVAEFLQLYYTGRDELPPDETNGNNPISRYKVATDAWRQLDTLLARTGDERLRETRDRIARLLPTGTPTNTRDVAAQTIGLCTIDKAAHSTQIAANVAKLLELQRGDGHWSVKFDPDYPITEMQTGESLYALSLAGLGPDHPAMRRGIAALLISQDEFGGWLDINPYEQFRTPFRETQWALMALSRIYPGPGTSGWNGPLGVQPGSLRIEAPSRLVADLEQVWDPPSLALCSQIIAQLEHPVPVVRLAACSTLARVGDRRAVRSLAARLGDDSKIVQRAAAEALRRIGNRLNQAAAPSTTLDHVHFTTAIEAALASPDARTRRGATRLFAAHFRDLSQQHELADALLDRLADHDAVVSMQAAKALWRFWYWQDDLSLRERIENGLIARLNEPAHPWVRRNVTDALYILCDENIRYLYKNWVPALARADDREQATAAQHATVNRLAGKIAQVLENGGPLAREGVLRALTEFSERPAVTSGRVGNDTEPVLVYGEMVARLGGALGSQLSDQDPLIRRLALQGMMSVRGSNDQSVARAVLAARGDADPEVRRWAAAQTAVFPVDVGSDVNVAPLLPVLDRLSTSEIADVRADAISLLGRLGARAGEEQVARIRSALADDSPVVRAASLRALAELPALAAMPDVRRAATASLASDNVSIRIAALDLALALPGLVSESALRSAIEDETPEHRMATLGLMLASKVRASDLRLLRVVAGAIESSDGGVREKALQVLQAHPALVVSAAVEEALRSLARLGNARHGEIARSLLATRGRSSSSEPDATVLDLSFFRANVLPVFTASAEDGQTCLGCHRSHTILRLVGPGGDGDWGPDRVLANYRAALRVVNLETPADSLLVNKPTWEAAEEAEAQLDPTRKAHAGGVRFEPGSPAHQVLLDWINGARLDAAAVR
jgi:HEAT repeat protein